MAAAPTDPVPPKQMQRRPDNGKQAKRADGNQRGGAGKGAEMGCLAAAGTAIESLGTCPHPRPFESGKRHTTPP